MRIHVSDREVWFFFHFSSSSLFLFRFSYCVTYPLTLCLLSFIHSFTWNLCPHGLNTTLFCTDTICNVHGLCVHLMMHIIQMNATVYKVLNVKFLRQISQMDMGDENNISDDDDGGDDNVRSQLRHRHQQHRKSFANACGLLYYQL